MPAFSAALRRTGASSGHPRSTCASVAAVAIAFATLSCTPVLGGMTEDYPGDDDPIGSYLNRAVPDSATVRAALGAVEEASTLMEDRKWDEAFTKLEGALATLPALADWAPILLAEVRAAAGDTAAVRRELAAAGRATDLVERWGWLLSVEAHEKADDLSGAARLAEIQARRSMPDTASARPNRDVAAQAWLRSGDLALADKDSARARAAFFQTLEVHPRSAHAARAARRLDDFRNLTPQESYEIGRVHHIHGDWARAWDRLNPRLTEEGVSAQERHALRFDLGRALFHMERYAEAERLLRPLTPDSVSEDVAAEALFWTGRAQYRQGQSRRAEGSATLERVADRYPEDRHAVEALILLAEIEEGAGRSGQARSLYERAFSTGRRSAELDLVAVRMGSSSYLAGDYRTAAASFDSYRTGSSRNASRQQAAFWAALSHDRLGNEAEARERYEEVYEIDPLTYYGAQAGNRLNLEILPWNLPSGPEGSWSVPREALDPAMQNALIRLAVHQRVPLAGSFAHELERQKKHFTLAEDRGYGYAEALIANGFEIQGILMGRDLHREEGEWNLRLLRIVYPFPYRESIMREATALGLDPFFVAGLIRQESMFRPDIVSPAGAVGLMQIMPATGRQLAPRAGVSSFSIAHLSDPEINIRMGTDFLATMLARFDGNITDALSAYNAGPTRIRRWQNLAEYRDPNVFIEHIPFRETRNYVKIVQQNAHIYTALYGCEAFSSCRGLPYGSISSQSVEQTTEQSGSDRSRNDR